MPSFKFALAVLALIMTACSSENTSLSRTTQSPAEFNSRPAQIIHGTRDTSARYDASVMLARRYSLADGFEKKYSCTGTLVNATTVLTAAHCVMGKDSRYCSSIDPWTGDYADCSVLHSEDLFVSIGDSYYSQRQEYAVAEIFFHESYDNYYLYNDIALIRLEQAVSDVTPIPILPDLPGFRLTQADVGTLDVLFVGYGNTSLNPLVVSTGVRMRMNDILDYFCEDESGCDPFDFGWSMGNHTAVFAPAQNEPASAGGDSGGPGFIQRNGIQYTALVHSWSYDVEFEGQYIYVRGTMDVSAYHDWLIEKSGGGMHLDNGAACISSAQCQSGHCVAGVCCDQLCNSMCQTCLARQGAIQDGICSFGDLVSCDDGDLCTTGDRCQAGQCVADPIECPSETDCTLASSCIPETGECAPVKNKDMGTICDDGDACTLNDYCFIGRCVAEGDVNCGDPGPCQTLPDNQKACDSKTGACHFESLPDGTNCGDKRHCQSGECVVKSSPSGCGIVGNDAALAIFLIIFVLQRAAFPKTRFH